MVTSDAAVLLAWLRDDMTQAPHKRWPLPGHCFVLLPRGRVWSIPACFQGRTRLAAGVARRFISLAGCRGGAVLLSCVLHGARHEDAVRIVPVVRERTARLETEAHVQAARRFEALHRAGFKAQLSIGAAIR